MILQFFYQPIFDVPHVPQLLNRIEKFKPPFEVDIVDFLDYTIDASLLSLGYNFTSHVHHLKLNRKSASEPEH